MKKYVYRIHSPINIYVDPKINRNQNCVYNYKEQVISLNMCYRKDEENKIIKFDEGFLK